jgi:hypothetical protein
LASMRSLSFTEVLAGVANASAKSEFVTTSYPALRSGRPGVYSAGGAISS